MPSPKPAQPVIGQTGRLLYITREIATPTEAPIPAFTRAFDQQELISLSRTFDSIPMS